MTRAPEIDPRIAPAGEAGEAGEADAPGRRAPVQREWALQETVAAFLGKALPYSAWWTSIDQGRAANARMGALRKARGIHAGCPDLVIVLGGVTLWIELKAGGSLSPPQIYARDMLTANGHRWALVRSADDVEAACRAAGIPLRATLGAIRERIAEQNERLPAKAKKKAAPRKAPPRATGSKAFAKRRIAAGTFW